MASAFAFCKEKQLLLPALHGPSDLFCKLFPVSTVKAHSKALSLSLFKIYQMSSTDPQNFSEITHLSYDITGNEVFPLRHLSESGVSFSSITHWCKLGIFTVVSGIMVKY